MRRKVCSLTSKGESFFGFTRYKQGELNAESPSVVWQMLLSLTPTQREVVTLYLLDNLSAEEISQELCIPKKTVYARIHHAKKRLRENATLLFR